MSPIVDAITVALGPFLDALNRLDRDPVPLVYTPGDAAVVLAVGEQLVGRPRRPAPTPGDTGC